VALGAALAGCASSSAEITPAYVSPVAYQSYTCQQLALEAQAVSTRAATLSGVQDSQRTKDQWTTAAAVVVFWPAAFLVQGDKQNAAELAQMKGQMVAIEQASIAKKMKNPRIWIAIFIGSTIGGFVPALWGGDMLSVAGVFWSGIGALAGLWVVNVT
jgi:hypothetical protein